MLRVWLIGLGVAVAMMAAGAGVRAEDDGQGGSSYVAQYPAGDVYQIQVIGDDIAEGLVGGLSEAFQGDAHVQVRPKPANLDTLMRSGFPDQLKALDEGLTKEPSTIAVVMIGPQDRVSFKGTAGKKVWIDHDEWKAEFGRQIDLVMKQLKRRRLAVYWVSLPNVRRAEPNEDVQVLNEIIRERVYLNGLKYIDSYAGFADEGGGYSAMGPDIAGKIRLLRESNGVSFTDAGNRKLAHFVEREMRRDLTQAKADRTIPLAGAEAEQSAISASRKAAAAIAKTVAPGVPSTAAPGAVAAGAGVVAAEVGTGSGDQKADSGRISLAVPGPGGKEDIVSVDLLRPAIPASVIALVNRKENADKATQLGDILIDQIPGGLMVMSSISPANDSAGGEKRRLAPTQTPYFRVMVKGERVSPREGRSDDVAWPRPEPPPYVEPVSVKVPAAVPDAAPPRASKKAVSKPKKADPE